MKTLLIFLLAAGVSANAQTNQIVSINFPTTLQYDAVPGGSRYETKPTPIKLNIRWSEMGRSGRPEGYFASIENYPYLRSQWQMDTVHTPFADVQQWHPLKPIRGNIRLVKASGLFNANGEPTMHTLKYEWVAESPGTNSTAKP